MAFLLFVLLYLVGAVGGYWFALWRLTIVDAECFPSLSTGDKWADARRDGGSFVAWYSAIVWPVAIPVIWIRSIFTIREYRR